MGYFNYIKTPITGLIVIENIKKNVTNEIKIQYDKNEFFSENLKMNFIQENQVFSKKGVLRGLHVQTKFSQGKLVRVDKGAIFDVAVDLRKDSTTYLNWFGIVLTEENNTQLYIPEYFAHGYYVLEEDTIISYKVNNEWHPEFEIGIPWDDPTLNIKWPIKKDDKIIIAEKDKNYHYLNKGGMF